jgi:predicted alpha/beta hydrolase family esterase
LLNFSLRTLTLLGSKPRWGRITVIHEDNDPVVPLAQAHFLADNLGTRVMVIKNGQHLNGSAGFTKLPAIVKALSVQ